MIKLLKNANVYAPAPLGMKDILIAGEKIERVDDHIEGYEGLPDVEVLDLEGKTLVPGYIDIHAHITGGGGEQGPSSRVPESQMSIFLRNGITTVLGLLGTDGITRSVENLVAKAKALNDEGMTAYCLTGAYGYPTVTVTGSVEKDIIMMSPMVGVKVAISDHRSSYPTGEELIKLVSYARRAGLISGTAGLVMIHMGSDKDGLDPVFYVLDHSNLPAKQMLPTHISRDPDLLDQGVELIRRGGFIDFTAGSVGMDLEETADKMLYAFSQEGVSLDHTSMSSDGFGSMPKFDDKGVCIGYTYASPNSLHETIRVLVKKGLPMEEALKLLTTTPANLLGKTGVKGCVAAGADADLLVYGEDMAIDSLFARGRTAVWQGDIRMKGRFEE